MSHVFRKIPKRLFGTKPIVRLRDIDAVVHNYRLFKKKADLTGSICAVVVKADVHGLKVEDVVPALYDEGVRHFFVEELCEGIKLRKIKNGVYVTVYAMAGILNDEEEYFYKYGITPCINSLNQLKRWNDYCRKHGKQRAVIHLDTHMNRLGLLDDAVDALSRNFDEFTSHVEIDCYMSHFFDIKGSDHSNCYMQLEILKKYLDKLPPKPVSFACTDSVILLDNKDVNFQMIRPGIGLVGGAPNAGCPVSQDAKHTVEIYAKFSQVKSVRKGLTIGYGGSYRTKRDTKIALVHIGYKDGYLRVLSGLDHMPGSGAHMYVDGYKIPVVGKISLGATTVDVTDVPDLILANAGYVEVVGPNVDIKYLADMVGCYEILMALGRPNDKIADYTLSEYYELYGRFQ